MMKDLEGVYEIDESDSNEIVEIVVQFVTPPAVALRLSHGGEHPDVHSLSEYEEKALEAHGAFREQLQLLMKDIATVEIFSEHHNLFNGVFMRVPKSMVEQIAQLDEVYSVTPNIECYVNTAEKNRDIVPAKRFADPSDFMQESLELFNIDYIHNTMSVTGKGVSVAVLDTGVDYNHPRLQRYQDPVTGRIRGRNFTTDDPNDIMDIHGHGTHVSGTVIAMAPDVELWHYKVLGDYGFGDLHWAITGVEAAYSDGVDVINLSFGSGLFDPINPMNMAVNLVMLGGVIVVVSAGNNGYWGLDSPGDASLPISVGSIGYDMKVSRFSSHGPTEHTYHIKPDIVAPGDEVISIVPDGGYAAESGTSMAAPHVSGLAALVLSRLPHAKSYEVKARIMNTASSLESTYGVEIVGSGLINPRNALQSETFATVRHNIPWVTTSERIMIKATMASLSFGFIASRMKSAPVTIMIHNAGADLWSEEVVFNSDHEGVSLKLINSNASDTNHTYTYEMHFAASAVSGFHEGNIILSSRDQRLILPFAAQFDRDVNDGLVIEPGEGLLDFGRIELGPWVWPQLVMVRNLGTCPTGELSISLSGLDRSSFRFDWLPTNSFNHTPLSFTLPNLNPGFWEEFVVQPQFHLDIGVYHATLVISGEGIPKEVISLRFEVVEPNEDIIFFFPRELNFGVAVVGYPEFEPELHHFFSMVDNPGQIVLGIAGRNPDAFDIIGEIHFDNLNPWFFSEMFLRPQTGLAVGRYEASVVARRVEDLNVLGSLDMYFRVVGSGAYGIALNHAADHDFGTSIVGFNNHGSHWVEVSNMGCEPIGSLTLALSGKDPDSFRLSASSISLEVGESVWFVVTPVDGISIGIHTATVSISGDKGILKEFSVSITVDLLPSGKKLGRIRDVFPDSNLAEIIAVLLGSDKTIDSMVTQLHLDMITIVSGEGAVIHSLEGVQYLRNVRMLNLAFCGISDLTPLGELVKLTVLDLFANHVQDLTPLSNVVSLRVLQLGWNFEICDITPLSGLVGLVELGLNDNRISDISPLASLVNLEVLWINNNEISDLSPLRGLERIIEFSAVGQIVIQFVDWWNPLVVANAVKDVNGRSIEPDMISHGGRYEDGKIIWVDLDEDTVIYSWDEWVSVGRSSGLFNGIVIVIERVD